jgi:hypothetical protein
MLFLCFHAPLNPTSTPGFWESNWQNLITTIIGSLISFLGALAIFMWSVRNEKNKKKRIDEQELQDILRFILHSMKRLNDPEKKLIASINTFLATLKTRKVGDIVFPYFPAFNFHWLQGIDKIKLQKAFLKHSPGTDVEKINDYNQFLTCIDLIDTINKQMKGDFMAYIDESRKFEGLFNQEKVRILKFYEPIISQFSKGTKPESLSPAWKEVYLLYKDWYALKVEDKKDIFMSYDNLIQSDNLLGYGWRTENYELIDAIRNITFYFHSYEKNQELNRGLFSSFSENIEKSFKAIEQIIGKFDVKVE